MTGLDNRNPRRRRRGHEITASSIIRRGVTINGKPANMTLDLRVQPGGAAAAQPLVKYGERFDVQVIIKEFP